MNAWVKYEGIHFLRAFTSIELMQYSRVLPIWNRRKEKSNLSMG